MNRFSLIVVTAALALGGCATDFHFSNQIYQGKNDPRHKLYANPRYTGQQAPTVEDVKSLSDHPTSEGPMTEDASKHAFKSEKTEKSFSGMN